MKLTIVNDDVERAVLSRVLNGYSDLVSDRITADEWRDEARYPREVWVEFSESNAGGRMPFIVVDNRDGNCYVEDFATLDGAMLYACDCHMTCELQDGWDYMGAVKDRGGLDLRKINDNSKEANNEKDKLRW